MKTQNRLKIVSSLAILLAAFSLIAFAPHTNAQGSEATAAATLSATEAATGEATAAATEAPITADAALTLAGYAVPREAYADLTKAFADNVQKQTGHKITFNESYQGSGTQARAIVGGFEADIAALSVEKDINTISDAKLITNDWKNTAYKGMVSDSVVVLAVRPGNPKGIKDFADLAQPGLQIITPDPATSGGAQWNLLAIYGAALRGKIPGVDANEDSALKFLGSVIKNFTVLDKDGRESFLTFERGVGDVAITYENETVAGLAAGGKFDVVYPASTILIENPVALVDVYVDKHGTRAAAQSFIDFLISTQGQQIFAAHGFRPVDPEIAKQPEIAKNFPAITDLFTIEYFKGWRPVSKELFGDSGKIGKLLLENHPQ